MSAVVCPWTITSYIMRIQSYYLLCGMRRASTAWRVIIEISKPLPPTSNTTDTVAFSFCVSTKFNGQSMLGATSRAAIVRSSMQHATESLSVSWKIIRLGCCDITWLPRINECLDCQPDNGDDEAIVLFGWMCSTVQCSDAIQRELSWADTLKMTAGIKTVTGIGCHE